MYTYAYFACNLLHLIVRDYPNAGNRPFFKICLWESGNAGMRNAECRMPECRNGGECSRANAERRNAEKKKKKNKYQVVPRFELGSQQSECCVITATLYNQVLAKLQSLVYYSTLL